MNTKYFVYVLMAALSLTLPHVGYTQSETMCMVSISNTTWYAKDVFVRDDIAYVALGQPVGLQTWNISDPSQPILLDSQSVPDTVAFSDTYTLYVVDNFAYIGMMEGGIAIFNISNPEMLVFESVSMLATPKSMDTDRSDRLYTAGNQVVRILDISNAPTVTLIGVTPDYGETNAISVKDTMMFVGIGINLLVFNISNPALPILISNTEVLSGTAECFELENDTLFVGDAGGFGIIHVDDPANPVQGECIGLMDHVRDIKAQDSRIYIANNGAGVAVYETTIPDSFVFLGMHDSPNTSFGVDLIDENVLIAADGFANLSVYRLRVEPGDCVPQPAHSLTIQLLPNDSIRFDWEHSNQDLNNHPILIDRYWIRPKADLACDPGPAYLEPVPPNAKTLIIHLPNCWNTGYYVQAVSK